MALAFEVVLRGSIGAPNNQGGKHVAPFVGACPCGRRCVRRGGGRRRACDCRVAGQSRFECVEREAEDIWSGARRLQHPASASSCTLPDFDLPNKVPMRLGSVVRMDGAEPSDFPRASLRLTLKFDESTVRAVHIPIPLTVPNGFGGAGELVQPVSSWSRSCLSPMLRSASPSLSACARTAVRRRPRRRRSCC